MENNTKVYITVQRPVANVNRVNLARSLELAYTPPSTGGAAVGVVVIARVIDGLKMDSFQVLTSSTPGGWAEAFKIHMPKTVLLHKYKRLGW